MEVCLTLSGGAARGLAHIGVAKALREAGYEIKAVSGSSAGALVGAFLSAGYSPEEMLEIAKSVSPLRVFKPSIPPKVSLLSPQPVLDFFREYLPERFESLKIPLWVSTTDLRRGGNILFHSGELYKPLLASVSIPPFFPPVEYENRLLNDGGFSNDLPVEPFLNGNCLRVCSDATPLGEVKRLDNLLEVFFRTLLISLRWNKVSKYPLCDLLIVPDLRGFSFVNYRRAEDYAERGYTAAVEALKSL